MTRRQLGCALFAGLPLSLTVQAQEPPRPNFSGRWRLLKEQSDFGKFAQPDLIVRVVDQRGTTMNVHTVQTTGKNTTSSDISYFTSGDVANNILSGREALSKAFWDGDTLVIRTSTKDSKGGAEEIVDSWSLSPDKNVLTISSHVLTESGSADLKLVCRRETVSR